MPDAAQNIRLLTQRFPYAKQMPQGEAPVEEGTVQQADYEEAPAEQAEPTGTVVKQAKGSNAKKGAVQQTGCEATGTCGIQQEVKPQVQPAQISSDGSAGADLSEPGGLITGGLNYIQQAPMQTSMANSGRMLRTGESMVDAAVKKQAIKVSEFQMEQQIAGVKAAEEAWEEGRASRRDEDTVGRAENTAIVLGTVGNTPGGLTSFVNQQLDYARKRHAQSGGKDDTFDEAGVRERAMREGIASAAAHIAIRGEMVVEAGFATEESVAGTPSASTDPSWKEEQIANMDIAVESIVNGLAANGGIGSEAELKSDLDNFIRVPIEHSLTKKYIESGRYETEDQARAEARKTGRLVYNYIVDSAVEHRLDPSFNETGAYKPPQPSDTPATQDDPIDSNNQLEDLRALKSRIGNPDTIF